MAKTVVRSPRLRPLVKFRRLMASGAVALLVGLGLVIAGDAVVGPSLTLAAFALTAYAVHGFGRLGPDGRERSSA